MPILSYIQKIDELIGSLGFCNRNSIRLLDYGCGKGFQYSKKRIHDSWHTPRPFLYDPNVPEFSKKPPINSFDGVLCVNVLEHVNFDSLESIIKDLYLYPNPLGRKTFIFIAIDCRLKDYPNATRKSPDWWQQLIFSFRTNRTRVIVHYT